MKVVGVCLDSGKEKFQNKIAIILIVVIRFYAVFELYLYVNIEFIRM
jgi:hypothetical protein